MTIIMPTIKVALSQALEEAHTEKHYLHKYVCIYKRPFVVSKLKKGYFSLTINKAYAKNIC